MVKDAKKIRVSDEEQARRLAICKGTKAADTAASISPCEYFDGKRCKKCGCYLSLKTRLATEHCPIGKW